MSAWRRRVDQPWAQLSAFAVLMVAVAGLVYHLTRGSSFLFDDWSFVLHRRGGSLSTYLAPHNQHFSLIPVAIYKFLFAAFGIGSYAPYRIVLIASNLLLYALVYLYARSRIGAWAALVLVALLALLGPGWEDILWPFQIGFVLSLCAGVGALLALERGTRRGDGIACALTMASLASSGVGIPVALGVVVAVVIRIAHERRPWREAWIVIVPIALFAAWWIGYQTGGSGLGGLSHAPGFVEKEAAAAMASLFGRAGSIGLDGPGTLTAWGTPLLIVALALITWRVVRGGPVSVGVLAPATMLLAFWVATAIARTGFIGNPFASRYIYVSATFTLLIAADLAAGWRPHALITAGLAAVAGIAIGSNVSELRTASELVRGFGRATTADLGAIEISRPVLPVGYVVHWLPGYPLIQLPAREFLRIEKSLGNPAAGVAGIESEDEGIRELVDRELFTIHRLAPAAASGGSAAASGGGAATRRGCRSVPRGQTVQLRTGTLLIAAGGAPVHLSARRFATLFQPVGTVAAGTSAELRVTADLSVVPWLLEPSSTGPVTVCGL